MSSATGSPEKDVLYDLPLGPAGASNDGESTPAEPDPRAAASMPAETDRDAETPDWLRRRTVTTGDRLTASGLDLGVAACVLTIALAVVRWMGVQVTLAQWPGFAAFLLAFSFLYFVIPLSFWGQTPGMSWAGIAARWDEDLPLSFGQSTQRWLGAVLTVALVGLPLLLGERTLADRMSGTTTVPARTR